MKKRIGIIFGGQSTEHEVSLSSAKSILAEIDRDLFEVVEIFIDKDGRFSVAENYCEELLNKKSIQAEPLIIDLVKKSFLAASEELKLDVIFPVLHGKFGEDGSLQGLLEILQIPYVGCKTLASAICMDKVICKNICENAGIPVVEYFSFQEFTWRKDSAAIEELIVGKISFPCFVKPANSGSSVGVSKAKNIIEFRAAVEKALKSDNKILVEKAREVREIECAVFGKNEPQLFELGEIIPGREFYDYEDKYLESGSSWQIPANIDAKTALKIRELAIEAFKILGISGLARIDFFLDKNSGEVFLNEVNTLPGFTNISMYPKMAAYSGVTMKKLITQLIEIA